MEFTHPTKESVLIVDDDRDLRETLADLLDCEGYRVDCAANGKEALLQLRRGPLPGLILLDLSMPVMNGWEFLAALREDATLASIPIVVCTAYDVTLLKRKPEGAAAILTKPTDTGELLSLTARYCG